MENLEEIHTDTCRTLQNSIQTLTIAQDQTGDPGAVRRQNYLLHCHANHWGPAMNCFSSFQFALLLLMSVRASVRAGIWVGRYVRVKVCPLVCTSVSSA